MLDHHYATILFVWDYFCFLRNFFCFFFCKLFLKKLKEFLFPLLKFLFFYMFVSFCGLSVHPICNVAPADIATDANNLKYDCVFYPCSLVRLAGIICICFDTCLCISLNNRLLLPTDPYPIHCHLKIIIRLRKILPIVMFLVMADNDIAAGLISWRIIVCLILVLGLGMVECYASTLLYIQD